MSDHFDASVLFHGSQNLRDRYSEVKVRPSKMYLNKFYSNFY